jgi:hypothetical protein
MAQLDAFSSTKSDHLARLFGPVWRDLLRDLVWELFEQLDPEDVVFTVDRRLFGRIPIRFDVRWRHIAAALVKLVGPKGGA